MPAVENTRLDFKRKAISLVENSLSLWSSMLWSRMLTMAISYGQMQYLKKYRMSVAFEILTSGAKALIGHQFEQYYIVFYIKMEDFRHEARLVAGVHMTKAPASITYASIVSRETDRIALMIVVLNDLEVKSGDVLNAYLQAAVTEKAWTSLGPEFSTYTRKTAVIDRALYGLNSA